MTFDELYKQADGLAKQALRNAATVAPNVLGLDPRAASVLMVGENFIACHQADEKALNEYGGFDHIDVNHRMSIGRFIFYSADDDRVCAYIESLDLIGE